MTISSFSGISSLHPLGILGDVIYAAGKEEGLLGELVVLAVEDLAEAANGLLELHVLAGPAGELLRDEHGLAHEALEAASTGDRDLVLLRQLVHPQDGDDVLQILVALQRSLHLA